jgi:ZIP Zinc transporter
MERWTAKLLALIGTFILPCFCTLLPYKVSGYITRKGAAGKRILSYLMCLGGGIFFGTYLLHMGPEVQTILKHALLEPNNITYPLAELIVGIGFFIVLFAEKIVLRWNKKRISRKRRKSCHRQSLETSKRDTLDRKVIHNEEQNTLVATRIDGVRCANPDNMCPECIVGEPCSGFDEEEM